MAARSSNKGSAASRSRPRGIGSKMIFCCSAALSATVFGQLDHTQLHHWAVGVPVESPAGIREAE
jgi:hypothetical protein